MFERQLFSQSSHLGLTEQSLLLEECIHRHDFASAWQIVLRNQCVWNTDYFKRQASRLAHISCKSGNKIFVLFDGFWIGFCPEASIIWSAFCCVAKSLDLRIELTESPGEADICVSSCFQRNYSNRSVNHCTQLLYLGENVRPFFNDYDYSLTTDPFDYLGRNAYLPVWLLTLYQDVGSFTTSPWLHVDLFEKSNLKLWKQWGFRKNAVVYVGSNCETMRVALIETLKTEGIPVDIYGASTRPVYDKQALYSGYQYILCPENSFYPGYATEKLVHALFSGAVSLYWGGISKAWEEDLMDRIIMIRPENISGLATRILSAEEPQVSLDGFVYRLRNETKNIYVNLCTHIAKIISLYD